MISLFNFFEVKTTIYETPDHASVEFTVMQLFYLNYFHLKFDLFNVKMTFMSLCDVKYLEEALRSQFVEIKQF